MWRQLWQLVSINSFSVSLKKILIHNFCNCFKNFAGMPFSAFVYYSLCDVMLLIGCIAETSYRTAWLKSDVASLFASVRSKGSFSFFVSAATKCNHEFFFLFCKRLFNSFFAISLQISATCTCRPFSHSHIVSTSPCFCLHTALFPNTSNVVEW